MPIDWTTEPTRWTRRERTMGKRRRRRRTRGEIDDGSGGGRLPTAAFHALAPDSGGVMQGVLTGTGGLTTVHADEEIYAPDHAGVYRPFANNTPVWSGGRAVSNLLLNSDDCTQNTGWTSSVNVTPTTIEFTSTSGHHYKRSETARRGLGIYIFSVVLSSSDVTQVGIVVNVNGDPDAEVPVTVDITNTPQRYYVTANITAGATGRIDAGLDMGKGGGQTGTVTATEWQLEYTEQPPGEYIATTTAELHQYRNTTLGNSFGAGNTVVEAAGSPLAESPYLVYQPAATNHVTYSRDISNAAWALTNGCTQSPTETGIDGTPNMGTVLTDPGAGYAAATHSSVGVSGASGEAVCAVCWIKKDAGATVYPEMQFTLNAAPNNWAQLDLVNGTVVGNRGNPGDGTEVLSVGDWWVLIQQVTSTGAYTGGTFRYQPAMSETPDVANSNLSGSITAGNAMVVKGTIAEVRGLGPIFTTTAAASTDATVYNFDAANGGDGSTHCWYTEVIKTGNGPISGAPAPDHQYIGIDSGNQGRPFSEAAWNGLTTSYYTGQVNTASMPGGTWNIIDTVQKIATVAHAAENKLTINHNGVYGTEGTMQAKVPTRCTVMNGNSHWPVMLRNLRRYDIEDFQSGKDLIDALMAPPEAP